MNSILELEISILFVRLQSQLYNFICAVEFSTHFGFHSQHPSSLDNDSLESSQTTPGQNVPSMSSLSSSNSILEKRSLFKSDKRNQPKFKKEWL